MITIDTSTTFGARAQLHLDNNQIIWLITVDGAGTPQPSPVWFIPHGDGILVYSQPHTAKIRNIERNGRVALHFDGDDHGNDITIITGVATIDRSLPAAVDLPAYLQKYDGGIKSINMTYQSFADEFSVPIFVEPIAIRGHYS